MRITKGQVTIPVDIREPAGAPPHTEVEFEFDAKVTRIVRTKAGGGRGARRGSFATARRRRDQHGSHHGADPRRLNDRRPG